MWTTFLLKGSLLPLTNHNKLSSRSDDSWRAFSKLLYEHLLKQITSATQAVPAAVVVASIRTNTAKADALQKFPPGLGDINPNLAERKVYVLYVPGLSSIPVVLERVDTL